MSEDDYNVEELLKKTNTEDRSVVEFYLRVRSTHATKSYFKAKKIARTLDISPQSVGKIMRALSMDENTGIEMEPRSGYRATTWKVTRA